LFEEVVTKDMARTREVCSNLFFLLKLLNKKKLNKIVL